MKNIIIILEITLSVYIITVKSPIKGHNILYVWANFYGLKIQCTLKED